MSVVAGINIFNSDLCFSIRIQFIIISRINKVTNLKMEHTTYIQFLLKIWSTQVYTSLRSLQWLLGSAKSRLRAS